MGGVHVAGHIVTQRLGALAWKYALCARQRAVSRRSRRSGLEAHEVENVAAKPNLALAFELLAVPAVIGSRPVVAFGSYSACKLAMWR